MKKSFIFFMGCSFLASAMQDGSNIALIPKGDVDKMPDSSKCQEIIGHVVALAAFDKWQKDTDNVPGKKFFDSAIREDNIVSPQWIDLYALYALQLNGDVHFFHYDDNFKQYVDNTKRQINALGNLCTWAQAHQGEVKSHLTEDDQTFFTETFLLHPTEMKKRWLKLRKHGLNSVGEVGMTTERACVASCSQQMIPCGAGCGMGLGSILFLTPAMWLSIPTYALCIAIPVMLGGACTCICNNIPCEKDENTPEKYDEPDSARRSKVIVKKINQACYELQQDNHED